MSTLPAFSITYVFNGDVSASAKVNASALDVQFGNLATAQNQTKAVLDTITDSSNNLAAQTVGLTQLKAEVTSALKLAGTTPGAIFKKITAIVTVALTTTGLVTDDVVIFTGTTTQTYNMPACVTGRELIFVNRSSATVTLNSIGSDTMNSSVTVTLTTGQMAFFYGNATDFAGRVF